MKGGKPQFSVSSIWGNVHTDFVQQDSHLLKIAYTACLCKSTALLVSCKLHKTFRFKTVRFIKLVIFHKFYTSFYTIPHKNLKWNHCLTQQFNLSICEVFFIEISIFQLSDLFLKNHKYIRLLETVILHNIFHWHIWTIPDFGVNTTIMLSSRNFP